MVHADDVAEEQIADDKGKAEEEGVLGQLEGGFAGRPRRGGQGALGAGVAFDLVFDAAENHFHEEGLRADPAAPEPAISGGEDHDAGEIEQQRDGEQGHVLRPKNPAENGETAGDDVEHEQRVAVDLDERPGKQNAQQQPAQIDAPLIKPALAVCGDKSIAAAPVHPPWPR